MYTFGIIGGGMIAEFHAKAIQAMGAHVQLGRYMRATRLEPSNWASSSLPGLFNLDDLLGDPTIDIVTIATPSGAHLEPALRRHAKNTSFVRSPGSYPAGAGNDRCG
ncbi:MAG: Gfo/Idh/MocA family oxidoreductase [Lewinellaceae bacterium]|nr:Gfo/Idh/MocA family oxidoreductase [Lewinellaceae bacterium]